MGEDATYKGQTIKIGTCEDMYYLRADQAHLVGTAPHSVDLTRYADRVRFRFPWPDEDAVEPGDFDPYERTMPVAGVTVPDGVDHYGRCVSSGMLCIRQQRIWGTRLVLVAECGSCGAAFRLPDLEDVEPVIVAVRSMADRAAEDDAPEWSARLHVIADRIAAGYEDGAADIVKGGAPAPAAEPAETLAPVVPIRRDQPTRYVSCVDTAKLVRRDLRTAFPGIKFSVRSDQYAGGAAIRVEWTDGPTDDAVTKVVKPYQGATFDGMTDSKDYVTVVVDGVPTHYGADWITTTRELSPSFRGAVLADARAYGIDCDPDDGSRWLDPCDTPHGLYRGGSGAGLIRFWAGHVSA